MIGWADRVIGEVSKVFVGQDKLVRGVLAALLADGHVLIESVPGLGKTLLVRASGGSSAARFNRIQFTPDLMPSDVTGSPIYDERIHDFRFRPGPVFTQILLADEINRAPAKTHSALLEIMQESRVTIDGVDSPDRAAVPGHGDPEPDRVGRDVQPARGPARPVPVQARGRLSRARPRRPTSSGCTPAGSAPTAALAEGLATVTGPAEVLEMQRRVRDGAGRRPRAGLHRGPGAKDAAVADVLAGRLAARGRGDPPRRRGPIAALEGRDYAVPDDVQEVVLPALRHRVMLTPEAEVEGRGRRRAADRADPSVEVPLR